MPTASRNRQNSQCAAIVLLMLAVLSGCGGSDDVERFDMSGTATFDGEPIVFGQIEFIPDIAQGNSGPAGSAEIVEGNYTTADTGIGVVKGPHLVRVTAYPSKLPEMPEDETAEMPPVPDPLFVGYTMELDLNSPEQNIDVPGDAAGFNLYQTNPAAGSDVP